jgi:hypothetical protein
MGMETALEWADVIRVRVVKLHPSSPMSRAVIASSFCLIISGPIIHTFGITGRSSSPIMAKGNN